ncbi:hypothetical protein INR49_020001 [Caranx melampygus]|nr:hypothetical protein INR49_020001 [Caranx melampygus]
MHSTYSDPGPGLLHDNVLSGSESGNLLRLAVDLSDIQHPWIVSHRSGTDIDPPCSSFSPSSSSLLLLPFLLFLFLLPKQTIFSNACPSCDICSQMSLVHNYPLTINKHSVSVISELVPMVCSVSKS